MQRVYDFLKKCGTYYLATIEREEPRVRPFGTIEIYNGFFYIQTGKSKDVSAQIHTNPSIEICAFDGEKWLRLTAEAQADESIEAQEHMLNAYPELKRMYQPGDGNTEVFRLEKPLAIFYSFTGEPEIIDCRGESGGDHYEHHDYHG